MNPDTIAALRSVLAENARIQALEDEIAHLRGKPKHAPADHLPCPFCGGKATVHSAIDASVAPKMERWNTTPSCGQCGATGPSAVGANHTEGIANAWAAWDRRIGGAR
jgi:transcription elongation factor Elf1